MSAPSQTNVGEARGLARWVYVVLHCFRLEEGHSYRETPTRLVYMAEIRDILGLDQDNLPDYSTNYKSLTDWNVDRAGIVVHFSAATSAVWPRSTRQHVLRPLISLIVLPPTVRQ